jgi:hypothetical protein
MDAAFIKWSWKDATTGFYNVFSPWNGDPDIANV